MTTFASADRWSSGDDYERYVGRWSRDVAPRFLAWLGAPSNGRWLDVGCGTGALIGAILAGADPVEVEGIDTSAAHVSYAMNALHDDRVVAKVADARQIPYDDHRFDVAVSGLALNFVPNPADAVAEMVRVTRTAGLVAAYVWDYRGRMEMMRHFWDAAKAADPEASAFDEAARFAAICHPETLARLFTDAGLGEVDTTAIDIATVFRDFDDFWSPFTGGQGTAPGYLVSRPEAVQSAIREQLRTTLPTAADGSIALTARALAVRGTVGAAGDSAHAASETMIDQKLDDLADAIDDLKQFED